VSDITVKRSYLFWVLTKHMNWLIIYGKDIEEIYIAGSKRGGIHRIIMLCSAL
jgi:hypothetical protein